VSCFGIAGNHEEEAVQDCRVSGAKNKFLSISMHEVTSTSIV